MTATNAAPGTRDKEATRRRLVDAVGTLLARKGFDALGVNAVATEAGVDKVLIYRYFGGMSDRLRAFGQSSDFWPSIEEVVGEDFAETMGLPLGERWALGLSRYARSLRCRPVTKEILAWEQVEQNALIEILREARDQWFEELMALFPDDNDVTDADLVSTILLIVGAIHYFIVLSRFRSDFSGMRLDTDEGWDHIDEVIRTMCRATLQES